eukprot:CAMPEP_0184341466 /NCGR_PEP_ID=MMETSP1089-20130417/10083_1 /TAXON_ID=38269 ORGANISM="Gloeochaete wittrockiana, Strain SAG46.84" /NCGR_SAMPLE_ID=MMETSP1089 /ASSEMBLY_ACC=CAM_ASM_000445 /LENGTH=159 /DNA_ID=CAMNT_0026669777 /DNA_START=649 /DNA_END=1128 /DNA_ORIENTATION=-
MMRVADPAVTKHYSDDDLMSILGIKETNSFGLWRLALKRGESTQCFAHGMYPLASFFNHSCVPNICRADRHTADSFGVDIAFQALRNIRSGEELTHAYILTNFPTGKRQFELLFHYHFKCACDRCRDDCGGEDEFTRTYVCPKCRILRYPDAEGCPWFP